MVFTPNFRPARISLTCLVEIYYGMHRRAHECTLEIDLPAKACRPARPSCLDATDRSMCEIALYNSVRVYTRIHVYSVPPPPRAVYPAMTFTDFRPISITTIDCESLRKFVFFSGKPR